MIAIRDFDTKLILGPASYEIRDKWVRRRKGTKHLDHRLSGFNCKIEIVEIDDKAKSIKPYP